MFINIGFEAQADREYSDLDGYLPIKGGGEEVVTTEIYNNTMWVD